jgi:carboxymethylenebutenolidase
VIETVGVPVADRPMTVRLARPEGFSGPRPALLVLHHKHGLDVFTEACLTRLAEAGYVAAAPDLYHRTDAPAYDDKMASLRDAQILDDAAAVVALLKADPMVRKNAIGVLGHCMGGRMSFMLAGAMPEAFAAAVVFYCGSMFKAWVDVGQAGPTPFERLKTIRCPVVGFFGNDDKNPSPADVDQFDAVLTAQGVRHVFHRYDGAAHAFQSFQTPALYRPAQSDDAWDKVMAWMVTELKPSAPKPQAEG